MHTRTFAVLALLLGLVGQAVAATKSLSGIELSSFEGRELLVFRTSGDVALPGAFKRNAETGTVTFQLAAEGAKLTDAALGLHGSLISGVVVSEDPIGTAVRVTMARPELADPACFRFSAPSRHVLLFEVFPQAAARNEAAPTPNLDEWLTEAQSPAKPVSDEPVPVRPAGSGTEPVSKTVSSFADKHGIASMDLRNADPQRVLGLAADLGLLNLRGRASVSTESMGSVSVKPGGQSLMSWTATTPPGEVYLAGTPEQIARFMQYGAPDFISAQPTLQQEWAAERPQASSKPVMGGRNSATRSRIKDDPHGGIYYNTYQPGGLKLSDIMVTLDATNGRDLYDVLNYLSEISGISLVIDPYAFDEPTGSRREPKTPEAPPANGGGSGFRQAGIFQPEGGRTGTVRGNFINVPFDQFLQMVLSTHELVYAVQSAGGPSDSGYGGASRGPGRGTTVGDPYQKPVILVTSPQRLEYELNGTNEINLQQFHYADPEQVAQIMSQFGMMPDINSGWYIYRGSGNGGNGTGGGNNGGFGGNNGGGNGNGAGGGRVASTAPEIIVYRGGSRAPVETAVAEALNAGKSVLRVVLQDEREGKPLVTMFSQSSKTH
jgi:hypothetical protein